MRDATGRSRCFAFLTFEDPASVNAVMVREHYLDGKIVSLRNVNGDFTTSSFNFIFVMTDRSEASNPTAGTSTSTEAVHRRIGRHRDIRVNAGVLLAVREGDRLDSDVGP